MPYEFIGHADEIEGRAPGKAIKQCPKIEEKWSGEIHKDLITIDKIIAEKQVLKEVEEEKSPREDSFEEGKNIKIKVKLEKNGNATIISNTN